MIKILLLLLVSVLVVICDQGPYPGPSYPTISWSLGIFKVYKNYHRDFQYCLNNRSSQRINDNPKMRRNQYQGANCHQAGLENQFTRHDLNETYDMLVSSRHWVSEGQEKRGNPGPQPAADILADIEWDSGLAKDAWKWARECTPGRDPCTLKNDAVGQTTISVLTPQKNDVTVRQLWHKWYNEVELFDKHLVADFNPDAETLQKIGNYSQLVWGRTTKVGCAKSVDFDGSMYRTTFVCNYWRQGNMKGQHVYKIHPGWKNDQWKDA